MSYSSLYENGPSQFNDASFSYYTGGNPHFGGVANLEVGNLTVNKAKSKNLSKMRQVSGNVYLPVGTNIVGRLYFPILIEGSPTEQITIPTGALLRRVQYSTVPVGAANSWINISANLDTTRAVFTKTYNGTQNLIQLNPSYTYTLTNQPAAPTALTAPGASLSDVNSNTTVNPTVPTGTTSANGIYLWLNVFGASVSTAAQTIKVTIDYSDPQNLNN